MGLSNLSHAAFRSLLAMNCMRKTHCAVMRSGVLRRQRGIVGMEYYIIDCFHVLGVLDDAPTSSSSALAAAYPRICSRPYAAHPYIAWEQLQFQLQCEPCVTRRTAQRWHQPILQYQAVLKAKKQTALTSCHKNPCRASFGRTVMTFMQAEILSTSRLDINTHMQCGPSNRVHQKHRETITVHQA